MRDSINGAGGAGGSLADGPGHRCVGTEGQAGGNINRAIEFELGLFGGSQIGRGDGRDFGKHGGLGT